MNSTTLQLIRCRACCPVPGVVAIFFGVWLAIGSAILGQSPAGPRVAVVTGDVGPRDIVVRPDGGTILSWVNQPSRFVIPFGCFARGLEAFDDVLDGDIITLLRVPRTSQGLVGCPRMTGNASGNLLFIYRFGRPYAIRAGFADGPRKVELNSNPKLYPQSGFGLAMDDRGDFFVSWGSLVDRRSGAKGIFGRLVNAQGEPVGPDIHVNTVSLGSLTSGSVAMSPETGQFVVVWEIGTGNGVQVAGQLFAPGGTRIGTEFRVDSVVEGNFSPLPVVTMERDGSFVIVWQEPNPNVPSQARAFSILGQRFGPSGSAVGSQFFVSEELDGDQVFPQVASDPNGNFVVVWDNRVNSGATARLYHADGTPAGPPRSLMAAELSVLSFGSNGTFAIAWTETNDFVGTILYERRFAASPGQEICAYSKPQFNPNGVFDCLTGRSNSSDALPAIHHPFGGQPGDIGLLGDIDGDGRADPCVFRTGVFLCDTNHDYGTTGVVVPFGQAGDIPFLGDVDGDGRADPCVYRSGHFLCDTGHQGAPAIDIAFGAPGDIPLLGDIDGDGRADPCVYRSGLFLCDTHHTGTADVQIQFDVAGDLPVLGDFDNDGRADPCVVSHADLLCDTAHNGQVGGRVHLWQAGLAPLFGNIDGL